MKNQLIDPLGTLCKLVALNFNEKNTKISIQNHLLLIQRPYNYQFLIRLCNGDGRENISELYYVIIRIIKWYIMPEIEEDKSSENLNYLEISKCEEFKKMINYLCSGFRKLQETYEYGNVVLALQFYINLLEDAKNNIYDDNKLPNYLLIKEQEYKNFLDYDKLKNFWDIKNIKRICELYDNCFKIYLDDNIPNNKKDKIINGYLKSIDAIIDITDQEFQNLIVNNSKR